ncbi:MAG: alpha amylase C-terminal domain-containing protein [Propionibacteriaceae bacterium]|nr:alpha amylase C-terminal domain-containing protein [Propionibacteriaceae bacterium]
MTTDRLPGMGALVSPDGIGFRVWAPHAETLSVVGTFNDWDAAATPLAEEGDGYWYGFDSRAQVGDEYRFELVNGEQRLSKVDPYAAQVTNSVGNGVIYDHAAFDWEGDDFTSPAHNELVIYELHAGTFATTEGEVGDLSEVSARLDHLVRLGVNAVQIMPVAEFAGDYSWGYNPAHIFAVESAYGGPDALKALVKNAHRRGLAVILDVVYNHFGPSDLNLWQFDGWSQDGKGGIYFYNDWRSATPWGDTRPDYGRGEVRQFIHDNALMWLSAFHLDGLRYDMTPYMRSVDATTTNIPEGWSLCRWINTDIRERYPDRILIAEDLHSDPSVSSTGPEGGAFHAQWDAQFVHPVREALIVADDAWRSTAEVAAAIGYSYGGDAFARVIYTESHDEVANGQARVPQEVDPDDPTGWYSRKRSTLGAGLVLTSPGIPMIFQGQEFLEGGWFRDDVPLDWDLDEEFHGIVRLYRDLVRLRRNTAGTTAGLTGQGCLIFHNNDDANLIAFQRWRDHGPGDDVVVVANLSAVARLGYRIGFPALGNWRLVFNSDAEVYCDDFGTEPAGDIEAEPDDYDGLQASGAITIGPYSVLVYSWEG